MIIKKLYNARKDLTETRNNTRKLNKTLEKVGGTIAKMPDRKAVRKSFADSFAAELRRRDIWERTPAEIERLADGRPIWAIKCPATEALVNLEKWFMGDYAYCLSLKKYFERDGIYAPIQIYEDWYCDTGAELEIQMGNFKDYHPDRRHADRLNVMWLVSHPENMTDEIAGRYDLILVDSKSLAEDMEGRSQARIEPFIVAADTDYFYRDDSPVVYDRVFVGNTRGVNRDCVKWCSDNKIELDVWGQGWERYYKDDPYIHLHGMANFDETGDIYRKSRIIINDHHHEMQKVGMINNRCPEVLLCGKTMLCDWSQGVEDEFGDMLTYYHGESDFLEALAEAEESYERKCAEIDRRYEELVEKYSFTTTIKRLIDIVNSARR